MVDDRDLTALAAQLGAQLKSAGETVAVAESCTGGWLGQVLTSVPGSSAWFDRGFVTYSNRAKMEMLGVDVELLARAGAVSEAIARAMADGALAHSPADRTVAVTGIAGPSGGTPEKPVGLVWFAWGRRGHPTRSASANFRGDRDSIRRQAVIFAIEEMMRDS